MAPPPTRARPRSSTSGSTASNRPRPISRASTTSLNTPSTQLAQTYRHTSEIAPIHEGHHAYSGEGAAPISEQQLNQPNHDYAIDPSLQNSNGGRRAMSIEHPYDSYQAQFRPVMDHQYAFESRDSQVPTNFNDEQIQEDSGLGETRKKKGSASSIANDQELRKLFRENHDRDLKDVAAEVLVHERGPRSEKTKQIFAMNW